MHGRRRPRRGRTSKGLETAVAQAKAAHPDRPVEVWAADEHRLGLKPIRRRVWAPAGARPVALGHHRYQWLHVAAFVQPTSGEAVWYLSTGLSKRFFAELLAAFAREIGAGRERSIVLVLDNAG
jgi:DDE superfamily endonuclease